MTRDKPYRDRPERAAEADHFAAIFYQALAKLTERQAEIIIAHFGLNGSVPLPPRPRSQLSNWGWRVYAPSSYSAYLPFNKWYPPLSDEPSDDLLSRFARWDREKGRYETKWEVFSHFESGIRKLRDEFNARALLEMRTDGVPPGVLARYRPKSATEASPLVHCERHQEWFDPDDPDSHPHGSCAACPCPIEQAGVGRRRLYCSTACRREVDRQRAKAKRNRKNP